MNATWIKEFLKSLEARIAPPVGTHHSLTFAQFGSDENGWKDELCLCVVRHNGSDKFFLSDSDLVHSPEDSAAVISNKIIPIIKARM